MILVTVIVFYSLSRFIEQVNTPYEVISHFLPEHAVILYFFRQYGKSRLGKFEIRIVRKKVESPRHFELSKFACIYNTYSTNTALLPYRWHDVEMTSY